MAVMTVKPRRKTQEPRLRETSVSPPCNALNDNNCSTNCGVLTWEEWVTLDDADQDAIIDGAKRHFGYNYVKGKTAGFRDGSQPPEACCYLEVEWDGHLVLHIRKDAFKWIDTVR